MIHQIDIKDNYEFMYNISEDLILVFYEDNKYLISNDNYFIVSDVKDFILTDNSTYLIKNEDNDTLNITKEQYELIVSAYIHYSQENK